MMSAPLPRVAHEIARIIGEFDAVRLCRRFGSRRLYIPQVITHDHPIALCIGFEQAERLAASFGGDSLDIPCLAVRRIRSIHQQIISDAEHMSQKQLAEKYRRSPRQIRNILRSATNG